MSVSVPCSAILLTYPWLLGSVRTVLLLIAYVFYKRKNNLPFLFLRPRLGLHTLQSRKTKKDVIFF